MGPHPRPTRNPHTHTHTHALTNTHTHKRAHTRAHTHTQQTSVAVAATFVGDFDILAMIVDACREKGEEPANGFFFPKILDHIFGLNLKQARCIDPEKVIGANKTTTDKSGTKPFQRHSKQGKMNRNDLAN